MEGLTLRAPNKVAGPLRATQHIRRIVVAIMPWQRSLPLAPAHARRLVKGVGAEIQLVTTVFDTRVAAGRERGDAVAGSRGEHMVDAARVELERLARSMHDLGASVTTRVIWQVSSYTGISAAAREWRADLVVIGVHEQTPLRARLTDTDWQLMRVVPCPLLIVKNSVFEG
jgi:nucleotide-binding universal stress UspA family protein